MIKILKYCITALLISKVVSQTSSTLKLDEGECNVININNYVSESQHQEEDLRRNVGAPGKQGPIGPPGPPGPMGRDCIECKTKIARLEEEIFTHEAANCEDLKARHNESGYYLINPDRTKVKPFYVYCNFSSSRAVTMVRHDTMNEMKITKKCSTRTCYSRVPQYEASMEQMAALVGTSAECRQFIKLRCQGVVLFYARHTENPYAYWVSRNGKIMQYWGGATSKRKGYCACGETGACVDPRDKCNCDNNSENVNTSDEGYLHDKNTLPVSEIKVGDTDGANEIGYHTLGPLECFGRGNVELFCFLLWANVLISLQINPKAMQYQYIATR